MTQLFPLPPLWLLFITTLSTAVPLSVLGLWCNVNNMQKTVWSIPINAVTRLLWVFYCVVTCIVLSILSWKTSIESLVMLIHTVIPHFWVDLKKKSLSDIKVTTPVSSKQVEVGIKCTSCSRSAHAWHLFRLAGCDNKCRPSSLFHLKQNLNLTMDHRHGC